VNHARCLTRLQRFRDTVLMVECAGGPPGGRRAGTDPCRARDWRDVQVLSQLAWMDEAWFTKDPERAGCERGKDSRQKDKTELKCQATGMTWAWCSAFARRRRAGRSELSTTPYFTTRSCRDLRFDIRAWGIRERRCRGGVVPDIRKMAREATERAKE